jgi:hypothetical protein
VERQESGTDWPKKRRKWLFAAKNYFQFICEIFFFFRLAA